MTSSVAKATPFATVFITMSNSPLLNKCFAFTTLYTWAVNRSPEWIWLPLLLYYVALVFPIMKASPTEDSWYYATPSALINVIPPQHTWTATSLGRCPKLKRRLRLGWRVVTALWKLGFDYWPRKSNLTRQHSSCVLWFECHIFGYPKMLVSAVSPPLQFASFDIHCLVCCFFK